MDAELRKILSKLVLGIRHLLEGYYDDRGVWHAGDLEQRLNQVGVWRDRPAKPLEELPQLSEADNKARRTVDAYIKYREGTGVNRAEAVEEFIWESAYTWFNWLFALRCMESREIIDPVILQKDTYGGLSLQHNRFVKQHPELCAGEDEGLYTVLFQEFERRAHELPTLFNPESPAVALRPSVSVIKKLVSILSGREPVNGEYASDKVFLAPDAFGWAYQYWNVEEKERVFEKVRTEKAKIEGKDIIPATCIYTEPYMVKFLVQNSLGAYWSCMYQKSKLFENWDYHVRDANRSLVNQKPVREITFLDPACGSGHFLLEAFNLYYEMYREEADLTTHEEICASILENNLFGIDIDKRAVQISIAVLWMKAKERAPQLDASSLSGFHDHLVATNIHLPRGRDHLEEFLRKHPEDKPLRDAFESILKALENVDEIGSLLKIEDPLERMFERLQTDHGIQTTLWSNGFTNIDSWRERVIRQLQEHFNEEVVSSDLTQSFFGQSVNTGLRLIELLSSKYDIVTANPPYLGDKKYGDALKSYLRKNYKKGWKDLVASFTERQLDLLKGEGIASQVTQHAVLTLDKFKELRKNILNNKTINIIVILGSGAFQEITGEVVNVSLWTFKHSTAINNENILFIDPSSGKTPNKKNRMLLNIINSKINVYKKKISKNIFKNIPSTNFGVYWLPSSLLKLFNKDIKNLERYCFVTKGLKTGQDKRFVRYFWECYDPDRWTIYHKGGGFCKWYGNDWWVVDWSTNINRISIRVSEKYPPEKYTLLIRDERYYFRTDIVYSAIGGGWLGLRKVTPGIASDAAQGIIPHTSIGEYVILSTLNCIISTAYARALSGGRLSFDKNYVLPIPYFRPLNMDTFDKLGEICRNLKMEYISYNIIERSFDKIVEPQNSILNIMKIFSILLTFESILEKLYVDEIKLDKNDYFYLQTILGKPSGNFPLIAKYDEIKISNSIKFNIIPYIKGLLNHDKKIESTDEILQIKNSLKI